MQRTVDWLPAVVWVILWLEAALLMVAELADVNTINAGVFSFAVCVFLLRSQACVADVLDELV